MLSRVHRFSKQALFPSSRILQWRKEKDKVQCNTVNKGPSSKECVERRVVSYVHWASPLCPALSWIPWDGVWSLLGGVPETLCESSPILGDHHLGWGLPTGRKAHLAMGFPGQGQDSIWQQHRNQVVENMIATNSSSEMFFSCVCTRWTSSQEITLLQDKETWNLISRMSLDLQLQTVEFSYSCFLLTVGWSLLPQAFKGMLEALKFFFTIKVRKSPIRPS